MATLGSLALFAIFLCIIVSMYGGGFATVPAYLADLFGTKMVGAIHGRLLTAWSVAGVLGPVIVNYIRDFQIDSGVPRTQAYNVIMYILAALLVLGFICNALIRPVDPKHHLKTDDAEAAAITKSAASMTPSAPAPVALTPAVAMAWLAVWIPIGWGVWATLAKASVLFRH